MYILNENKLKGVTRTPRHVLKKLNLLKKSLSLFFSFFSLFLRMELFIFRETVKTVTFHTSPKT